MSISHLAYDASSNVWHLTHHICDVSLRNVPAFDVCSNTTWVSELQTLPCDVMFTYQTRRFFCVQKCDKLRS